MTADDDTPPAAAEPLPVMVLAASSRGRLPRLRVQPGYEALAGFLESDLQGGLSGIARLLADLGRVERGELEGLERTSNAYRLTLRNGEARLHPLEGPELSGCRIDAQLFRRCVEAWQAALLS